MEKNQAAIDKGRYEVENMRFFRPNEYWQQDHESRPYTNEPPYVQGPHNEPPVAASSSTVDTGEPSHRSKLANFFKGSGHSSGQADMNNSSKSPPPERARLKKRSSSRLAHARLGAVGE
jgi:hypothetical protein